MGLHGRRCYGFLWSSPRWCRAPGWHLLTSSLLAIRPSIFEGRSLYLLRTSVLHRGVSNLAVSIWPRTRSFGADPGRESRLGVPFALPDGSIAFISKGDLLPIEAGRDRIGHRTAHLHRRSASSRPLYCQTGGSCFSSVQEQPRERLFTMLPDGTWSTLWPGLDDVSVSAISPILDREVACWFSTDRLRISGWCRYRRSLRGQKRASRWISGGVHPEPLPG